MENNLEALNQWKNGLSCYKELTISEAQQLYKNSLEDISKKNYFNELIMGTLYIIPNFISNNGFIYLNSSSYDMNDIISACNEIWISKISSGKLLEISSFREMFDSEFYNKLNDGLGISKYSPDYSILNINLFVELLVDYIKFKEIDYDFDYMRFINYIKKSPKYKNFLNRMCYYRDNIDYSEIYNTCQTFDGIMNSFESNESDIKITKTTIDKLKYILISNGFEYLRPNINNIFVNDTTQELLDEYSRKQIVDIVMNSHLSNSHKEILIKRYGLFNERCHTFEEVAKEQGLTREGIRQKEAKALRMLRHPIYSKQLKEYM